MPSSFFAAVAVLALLTVVPGPDVAVVSRFALAGGVRAGVRAAGGVVVGLSVWGILVVIGLASALAASAVAYTVIKLAGAAYLIFMGATMLWRTRRSAPPELTPHRVSASRAGRAGLVTNLLNPKIAVFYTSLLPSLIPSRGSAVVWLTALVGAHVAMSLAWLSTWSAAVAHSKSLINRPRTRVLLQRLTGVALIGFGLRLAAEAR